MGLPPIAPQPPIRPLQPTAPLQPAQPAQPTQPVPPVEPPVLQPPVPPIQIDPAIRIAALQAEIGTLQSKVQQLQGALDAEKAQVRAPDDFATGLQLALDKLQTALSHADNPTSTFAVREFRLETNVHVGVTPLGTVQYRFPAFDEKVEPTSLSRLTVDLVAVPRDRAADATEDAPLEDVAGLDDTQRAVLRQNGIATAKDFLAVGTRARTSVAVASLLNVDRANLSTLVSTVKLLPLRAAVVEPAAQPAPVKPT